VLALRALHHCAVTVSLCPFLSSRSHLLQSSPFLSNSLNLTDMDLLVSLWSKSSQLFNDAANLTLSQNSTSSSAGQAPSTISPSRTTRPSHIDIPPPIFTSQSLTPSPSHPWSDPFDDALPSPCLHFYTAPSSPLPEDPPTAVPARSPPSPPPFLQITIPQGPQLTEHHYHQSETDDAFPTAQVAIDLAMDDEGLSTLEKIYLFSRSKATFHRVFIAHALPSFLEQVTPLEAIEYVLPLLSGLAMDEGTSINLQCHSQRLMSSNLQMNR